MKRQRSGISWHPTSDQNNSTEKVVHMYNKTMELNQGLAQWKIEQNHERQKHKVRKSEQNKNNLEQITELNN